MQLTCMVDSRFVLTDISSYMIILLAFECFIPGIASFVMTLFLQFSSKISPSYGTTNDPCKIALGSTNTLNKST